MKKIVEEFKYYRKIKRSNLGRDFGWYIEFEGKIIGELEQIQEEHYRNSYVIKNADINYIQEMNTMQFWQEKYEKIYYINREFKKYKTRASASILLVPANRIKQNQVLIVLLFL